MVDGTIRCPWHHACFDLRTGEALRAPAFDPLSCWVVELRSDRVFVHNKSSQPKALKNGKSVSDTSERIVIVGGGAAGFATAETLRRAKFAGSIVMLSNDASAPVDRPSLSKDYLAGNAPEDRVPLRPESFYSENAIDLRAATEVVRLDPGSREIALSDGQSIAAGSVSASTLRSTDSAVFGETPGPTPPFFSPAMALWSCNASPQNAPLPKVS